MSSPSLTTDASAQPALPAGQVAFNPASTPAAKTPIFDLSKIDLTACAVSKHELEKTNAHRDKLALLDKIVWYTPNFQQGVALWHVRPDEFWVPGHFPGRPILPGVLQVEASAQLGVFLFNARWPAPKLCAFTHISDCVFRGQVVPGDDLYLLCQEIRVTERRFESFVQGVVKGKVVFSATINGMTIG